ncbi:MAG: hypothetical protein A3F13_04630 [Gammaproteobacteria bacterium RIFCSPHIGHO2_12_FULL_40_19]|nr:MAG: hypothetical protein A3F13_04630 [Gammaproteobacteria bacterium RIFCSPHIGHO2_12_FULL_40_19]
MNFFLAFSLSISVGIFTTLTCIYLLRPAAEHIGLVDTPGGRKMHADAVPLIGGIAIFVGFCFSLLCLNVSLHDYRGLLAGSAILVLIGVMDDFRELTPRIRLVGQCLASLLLIEWGHLSVDHLGDLFFFGSVNLGVGSFLFTLFFVLGFINAINMIDGHDGLAGTIVLGQALLFAFLCMHFHQINNAQVLIIFIAMLSVFLMFNLPLPWRKRASIFMGDAGSTFIGFVIAWFAVDISQAMFVHKHTSFSYSPVTILWVLAYPLFDLLAVILHRLFSRRSPFLASRDHLHYLLVDFGFRPAKVTFLLFLFSLLLGLMGIILAEQKIPEPWQLITFFVVFTFYYLSTLVFQRKLVPA